MITSTEEPRGSDHEEITTRGGKSADGLKTMLAVGSDRKTSPLLTPSLLRPSVEVGRSAVPLGLPKASLPNPSPVGETLPFLVLAIIWGLMVRIPNG